MANDRIKIPELMDAGPLELTDHLILSQDGRTRKVQVQGLAKRMNVIEIAYDDLAALKNANGLIPGQQYLLADFMTIYRQPVTGIVWRGRKEAPMPEPLIVNIKEIEEGANLRNARVFVDSDSLSVNFDISSMFANQERHNVITANDLNVVGPGNPGICFYANEENSELILHVIVGFETHEASLMKANTVDGEFTVNGELCFEGAEDLIATLNDSANLSGNPLLDYILDHVFIELDREYNKAGEEIAYEDDPGGIEPLVVTALSESELQPLAYSPLYPNDIIHYDITQGNTAKYDWAVAGNPLEKPRNYTAEDFALATNDRGQIYRRVAGNGNSLPYDSRMIRFRRYQIDHNSINPMWVPSTVYAAGDSVLHINAYEGHIGIYVALKSNANTEPYKDNSLTWKYLGPADGKGSYIGTDPSGIIVHIAGSAYTVPVKPGIFKDFYTFDDGTGANQIDLPSIHGNEIAPYWIGFDLQGLNNSVFFGDSCENNKIGEYFNNNTVFNDFYDNRIGGYFEHNLIGNDLSDSANGDRFSGNAIGNWFTGNFIGNGFSGNNIGCDFKGSLIGDGFGDNIIISEFSNNTIGDNFKNNIIFENGIIENAFCDRVIGNGFKDYMPKLSPDKIKQDESNRFVTDVEKDVWNSAEGNAKSYADGKISAINALIPSQANSANQLADKDFVNSSITHMAAYFVTYNAGGDAFPTKAALMGAATVYHQGMAYTPTENDYCAVLADESKDGAQTRYSFDGANWVFQYKINDKPFTAEQNAAINSGMTAADKSKLNGIAAGAQVNPAVATDLSCDASCSAIAIDLRVNNA